MGTLKSSLPIHNRNNGVSCLPEHGQGWMYCSWLQNNFGCNQYFGFFKNKLKRVEISGRIRNGSNYKKSKSLLFIQ